MRLISAGTLLYLLAVTDTTSGFADTGHRHQREGQSIFRYDTFGDE